MKKHSILTLISAALLGFGAASCDDYLDVNNNIDAPDYVDGYLYLAGIQQEYCNLYYDATYATMSLSQMSTGYSGSYGTHYYPAGSDTGGAIWRMVYWQQGMNLENMINQSIAEENWHLAGIGLVMKAYSWDVLTKYHGEAPLRQAFDTSLLSFDYQYQDEIYASIRKWALEGIKYLEMDDKTLLKNYIAGNDFIYGGDIEKWKKFGYYVLVRNLASLTRKTDFATKYYNDLVNYASLAFASADDDAKVKVAGGGADAPSSSYNNFWGVFRENLGNSYFQYDWAVQVMTGTVRELDENWDKIKVPGSRYLYKLMDNQIITDTLVYEQGHWDPRIAIKLTTNDGTYESPIVDPATGDTIDYETKIQTDLDSIKNFNYYGGNLGSASGPIGTAANYYGGPSGWTVNTARFHEGRWLFHNDAPYILGTYAEMMFCLAEAHFIAGNKAEALDAWKKGVKGDMDFTVKHLTAAKLETGGSSRTFYNGDKLTASQFKAAANEYLAGPFVEGITADKLTLSHIMMQKFVALYPWGSLEAWVDQRKYHYDIEYTGNYPALGNGWDYNTIFQKRDDDPNKVFKGYYLSPAEARGTAYDTNNSGSPCYRIRPRYNSEYVWNEHKLAVLKPIAGTAANYQCSMPWFCYPGDQPGAPVYTETAE